jgi:isoquinoline 1-oxidoreductase alpha subunit
MLTINVNGTKRDVQSSGDTPLLYVLRNELELSSPQFGCGLAQCGICSVLLDGKEIRSCITPVSAVGAKEVTTVEGLPSRWAKQKNLSVAEAERTLHPVQQGWIEEQTPLCGFCQSGMMIKATELLEKTPVPRFLKSKQRSPPRDPLHIYAVAGATWQSSKLFSSRHA